MKPDTRTPRDNDGEDESGESLRRRAEQRMGEKAQGQHPAVKKEDMEKLIHELQVHQIELEIQNEELLRARDEVETGLERYTELYDFAPVGYFTLDRNGTIRQVNLSGAALLGRERSLLVDRRFHDFVSAECCPAFNGFLHTVFGQPAKKTRSVELTLNGDPPIVIQMEAHVTGSGEECFMAVTDITGLKRAKEALQTTNQKLNILSSITRHDIKNQLIIILGFLELSRKKITDPEVRHFLDQEEKAAQIIEQQIEFTKSYENIGVNAPQWQDVAACLAALKSSLPLGEIDVSVSLEPLEVFADPMFEKVFYNLIDNSLRYGGEAMTGIRISSHETDAGLVVVCEDNGDGIAKENKKRLFERGFGKNTGFGLFLSREILSITGITITETGEPGKGARFEIHVPKGFYRHGNR